jgi:hypothetical protein
MKLLVVRTHHRETNANLIAPFKRGLPFTFRQTDNTTFMNDRFWAIRLTGMGTKCEFAESEAAVQWRPRPSGR